MKCDGCIYNVDDLDTIVAKCLDCKRSYKENTDQFKRFLDLYEDENDMYGTEE